MIEIPSQRAHQEIGRSGCYFLCLVHIAERQTRKSIDVTRAYQELVSRAHLRDDCFVSNPEAVLKFLTGGRYHVRWEGCGFNPETVDIAVAQYNYRGRQHFVVQNEKGRIVYDPLGEGSLVTKRGEIDSWRVFRKEER